MLLDAVAKFSIHCIPTPQLVSDSWGWREIKLNRYLIWQTEHAFFLIGIAKNQMKQEMTMFSRNDLRCFFWLGCALALLGCWHRLAGNRPWFPSINRLLRGDRSFDQFQLLGPWTFVLRFRCSQYCHLGQLVENWSTKNQTRTLGRRGSAEEPLDTAGYVTGAFDRKCFGFISACDG